MDTTLASPHTTWQQKLAASRFFVVSTTLHIALIASLLSVFVTMPERPPEFTGEPGEPPENVVPIDTTVDRPPVDDGPPPKIETPTFAPVDSLTTKAPVTHIVSQREISIEIPNEHIWKFGKGPGNSLLDELPDTMSSRSPANRSRIGAARKMTPAAEDAVIRGLKWLRANQNPDGSWGEANKGAMTGLALLCFLGHGETDLSTEYGLHVSRAIDWILATGTKFQGRLHMDDAFRRNSDVYEHGICTYALAEYFTMTKDQRVIELLAQAVGHIVQGQGPRGGWMYNFDKTADDLSVSGWQIQALKAAHLTGLNLPGVDAALDKSVECIEKVWQGPKGGYGYRGKEDRYSLTGAGVLCRLFWKGKHGEVDKGMDFILDETEKNKPVKYKSNNADLYAWYYHTQAALMFGGGTWAKWNGWFQQELIGAQNPDGSWPSPGMKQHGPMNEETMTGKVYRTTLCVLMLEVFYRYMPSNKAI